SRRLRQRPDFRSRRSCRCRRTTTCWCSRAPCGRIDRAACSGQNRAMQNSEPILDIAHLGHLEMLTPKFEESRRFFIDVMGMTQSGEKGDSVYLRGWDDYERYSLKLTASKTSGMAHVAFRTRSPQALERRAE